MTNSIHASLTAIGGQLRAYHLPTVVEPLPGELKELVAQLVAVEFRKQESAERSIEVWQSVIAPAGPLSY